MNLKDIKTCTECSGKGTCGFDAKGLFKKSTGPHCKGTGIEPVRSKLDVPDEYYFYDFEEPRGFQHYAVFTTKKKMKDYWTALNEQFLRFKLPHPIGTTITLVCEDCDGDGRFCVEQGYSFDEPCEYENCQSCNGNPRRTYKLKDVVVECDMLVEYWEEA